MASAYEFDIIKLIRLSEWDKILLTLIAASLLPLFVHALPWSSAARSGQVWLPIFYAPLIASLCFRPHVALVTGLLAPGINHFLFGMPSDRMLGALTLELVLFSLSVWALRKQARISALTVIAAFVVARVVTCLVLRQCPFELFLGNLVQSLVTALPGCVMLGVITALVHPWAQRRDRCRT